MVVQWWDLEIIESRLIKREIFNQIWVHFKNIPCDCAPYSTVHLHFLQQTNMSFAPIKFDKTKYLAIYLCSSILLVSSRYWRSSSKLQNRKQQRHRFSNTWRDLWPQNQLKVITLANQNRERHPNDNIRPRIKEIGTLRWEDGDDRENVA